MTERVGELLKSFLRKQGPAEAETCFSLAQGWKALVGAPLQDHSRPLDVRNGMLVVEVDHPGWMQRLQMQQDRLLAQVRRRYPQLQVRGLSIRVGLKLAHGADGASPAPEAAAALPEDIEDDLERVKEKELRGLLLRLYARVVERNRPDRAQGGEA